ncbi:hypothetical protein GCM10017600_17070 [Streptosporangium carneum]|uniref:Uncharacterized protein n=1 Tax=Streptosporangium carneum TaxID=47481 RepID=A0A9W6HY96_9ACTN|nr:hypothetical protein GCM10017600_17070 [Streptosporangium carneum]
MGENLGVTPTAVGESACGCPSIVSSFTGSRSSSAAVAAGPEGPAGQEDTTREE